MLHEIICNEFKQHRIEFHSGLNTVLGTVSGDNSIGKSTILLVVDFVFGGTTYAESEDIIKNVGAHEIYFAFIFDNTTYKFSRDTVKYREVWICNESYKKAKSISLEDFCKWLDKQYNMQLPFLTFRNSVSRYIRVYGKDNAYEKLPLHTVSNEKMHDACYALLKLFDLYTPVHQLVQQTAASADELKSYQKAQKLNFIDHIGKHEYLKNKNSIAQIKEELETLTENVEKGFSTLDAEISDEAIRLKKLLSNARRMRSRIKISLDSITEDFEYKFSTTTEEFQKLEEYFPNVNLQQLKSIEEFHKNISKVFKKELSSEKRKLSSELKDYNEVITNYEKQLSELIVSPKISKTVLTRYSELIRQIDKMQHENDCYNRLLRLKTNKAEDNDRLKSIEKKQFAILQNLINKEMYKVNEYIYSGTSNSPVINFSDGSYCFFTPDDTGTGVAYKGLIVFDLAVLHLSKLPILVHDSIVLKQISDNAIESILKLYDNNGKQVIIALDKQDSYTAQSEKILKEKAVLYLASNGNELFGRSWG